MSPTEEQTGEVLLNHNSSYINSMTILVNLQLEEYWMGFRGSGFILRIWRRRTDGREGSVLA